MLSGTGRKANIGTEFGVSAIFYTSVGYFGAESRSRHGLGPM